MNLLKGINTEEEFLFSENIFGISHKAGLEKFTKDMETIRERYDDSTMMVDVKCGYLEGDVLPEGSLGGL